MSEILTACVGCGRAMAPNAVLYDREARPICDDCYHQADLLATDRRAADNIRKAGYVCLAGGVVGLIAPIAHFGFFAACVIVVLTSGVYALQSLARGNERFTKHLTPMQQQLAWVFTIGGISMVGLSLLGVNLSLLVR